MFERFTERARQVIVLAQEEARQNKNDHISIWHLLGGLIREEEGLASKVLDQNHISLEKVRGFYDPPSADELPPQIPFTPDAKKALEASLREALSLGNNYIGTEHILLGWLRHKPHLLDADVMRNDVTRMLSQPKTRPHLKDPEIEARRAELKEELRKLDEEERRLLALGPAHRLAEFLHKQLCHYNHVDHCGWEYEFKNGQPEWDASWHKMYLEKARRALMVAGEDTIKKVLEAVR